ncbi:MAG TPA: ATP-binding protein [Caulobacteraceae bacterium]|jgi:anti-sigma regulatory factor (Ser/Thr protein kinase)
MSQAESRSGLRAVRRSGETLQLVLNNDMAAIESGRREIRDWLDPAKLSPKVTNRWEVVFEEVVSNIVRHGFSPGGSHTIVVDAARTRDTIEFTFDDDGQFFDPLGAPEPAPLRSLETAPLGGLGVPLTRRLSTAMSYTRDPKDRPDEEAAEPGFAPRNRLRVTIATEA